MFGLITLLTDFGTADGYLGEMKGVLASTAPGVTIVDVGHDLSAHDVESARLAVARYWQRFPAGTVHLVVVDPGVGSARAALAVESERRLLVGPDNGVLSLALLHPGARCVALPLPTGASATFHGRDVFAPAAAKLATGTPIDALGTPHDAPVVRRTPEATRRADGSVSGIVMTMDRFGNLITNLVAYRGGMIELGFHSIPLRHTYADVEIGELVAVIGSSGLVEIAVREGHAGSHLGVSRGATVVLRATDIPS